MMKERDTETVKGKRKLKTRYRSRARARVATLKGPQDQTVRVKKLRRPSASPAEKPLLEFVSRRGLRTNGAGEERIGERLPR
jgi:hypothetical protein